MGMLYRIAVVFCLALSAFAGDWNPRRAAEYLDARQQEWFAWPAANNGAKPCISCHTGLPYLMARPALRKALGEKEPTQYETGLLDSLRSRIDKKEPNGPSLGVESVMAAFFLRTPAAYDRMWEMQVKDGATPGGFKWFNLDLDPWEEPESQLFGASLAAVAVNNAPADYRDRPDVKERTAALAAFLKAPHEKQPLQNRLLVAWASNDASLRKSVAAEVLARQSPDGGWTMESLGPWHTHANAPEAKPGNNTYATAFASYVLMQCGTPKAQLTKAVDWLRSHQSDHGYFYADSLNKQYKPDSMEIRFMRDAATGWASLALLQ